MFKKILFLTALLFTLGTVLPARSEESSDGKELKTWINEVAEHIRLSGYAQAGFNYYDQSSPKDQFKIARIILMAEAQVTRDLTAYTMFDLKEAKLQELWFSYKFCPQVQLKLGQFKTPFSIENPISPTRLEMIYPASLVTSHMIRGGSPLMMKGASGRDIGVTLYGALFQGFLQYDLALMNGAGRNNTDDNSQKDFVARLTLNPLNELSLSGSLIKGTGNLPVHLADDGTTWISDAAGITGLKHNGNYRRDRYAVGVQLKTRPAALRTEMMWGLDGRNHSRGFYATGSINNLFFNHFDLVASFDWIDVYSGMSRRYSAGLQYWFLPMCRLQLGYGYTNRSAEHDENCILAQIQVRF